MLVGSVRLGGLAVALTLLPGDVALVRGNGIVPSLIEVGDAIKCRRLGLPHKNYSHAALYVGNGLVVQARPRGANEIPVGQLSGVVDWYRVPNLDTPTRTRVAASGTVLIGTPYNWLDIGALTLECFGWNVQTRDGKLTKLGERIADNDELICSALVYRAYQLAGIELSADARWASEVSPADLARCPMLVRVVTLGVVA